MKAAVVIALYLGLYLAFAGALSLSEVVTGAIAAMGVALWTTAIRRASTRRFSLSPLALRPIVASVSGLAWAVLSSARPLFLATLRGGSVGSMERTPFTWADEGDAHQRGRRALAVIFAGLAPDRFVVRTELERGAVLFHSLTRRAPADPETLA